MGDYPSDESEIDARVKLAFELNDLELVTDLRHFNKGQISIYNPFWDEAKKFLENTTQDSVVAIDERRHDPIVHLARAISVKDLRNQIANRCPENTPGYNFGLRIYGICQACSLLDSYLLNLWYKFVNYV